ncbi:MAG: MBL fold metallo-hydrolase [Patescibacteria group bacterium]|jgi:L-ascorbate metabolism protein UlaG (beta-lactamase superfamily)
MYITWHGQSAIKIQTETGTVFIDPQNSASGIKPTRITTDLLLIGDPDAPKGGNAETTFVVDHPGEYESKGVFVYSVETTPEQMVSGKRGMIFLVQAEDLRVAHLGFLKAPLTDVQKELLDEADVLIIPVGGNAVCTPKLAADIVSEMEPRIILPIHYKIAGSKEKLDDVQPFLKEIGVKEERMEKLRIKKKDLPQEDAQLVLLDVYGKH